MEKIVFDHIKPQIYADERRFVYLNIQHFSEIYHRNSLIKSPQSTQRSQSFAISVTAYETAPTSQRGTRMTRIARINLRASVFHNNPYAYFQVHPQLILDRKTQEVLVV